MTALVRRLPVGPAPAIDLDAADVAARALLLALEPTSATRVRDTPARMAQGYAELLTPARIDLTTFPNTDGYDELIVVRLDTVSRSLLESGDFARFVERCGVTGATSNPTIFATAITGSDRYDGQLHALAAAGTRDPRAIFFTRSFTCK